MEEQMKPVCPFCAIALDNEPATRRYDKYGVQGIVPLNPCTPGHVVFFHQTHTTDLREDVGVLVDVMEAIWDYASDSYVGDFNVIINNGPLASRTVDHLHVHFVPRRKNDGLLLPWPQAHNRLQR